MGNLIREILAMMESRVPWSEELVDFVVKTRDDIRSYARMNRRFVAQGIYVPSPSGETIGPILLASDTSGSILTDELVQCVSEIVKIKEDFNPERIEVIYFDTAVAGHQTFYPDDDIVLNPVGGGGTRFASIFEWVKEQEMDDLQCMIVLTDMCDYEFGEEPECPVLWVSTEPTYRWTPPFGRVIIMNEVKK